MWKRVNRTMRFPFWLGLIIFCFVFSSCAAVGKIVEPDVWLGVLDLSVAGGITLYIFRGGDEV